MMMMMIMTMMVAVVVVMLRLHKLLNGMTHGKEVFRLKHRILDLLNDARSA